LNIVTLLDMAASGNPDRVAVGRLSGNAFAQALFAAAWAGIPLVRLNYRLGRDQLAELLGRPQGGGAPAQAPDLVSAYESSNGNAVLMRAPYASIARSRFFEAMWPTRKAMPSGSTSLIIVHSVTRR